MGMRWNWIKVSSLRWVAQTVPNFGFLLIALRVGEVIGRKDQDLTHLLSRGKDEDQVPTLKDETAGVELPINVELQEPMSRPKSLKAVLRQMPQMQDQSSQISIHYQETSELGKQSHPRSTKRQKISLEDDLSGCFHSEQQIVSFGISTPDLVAAPIVTWDPLIQKSPNHDISAPPREKQVLPFSLATVSSDLRDSTTNYSPDADSVKTYCPESNQRVEMQAVLPSNGLQASTNPLPSESTKSNMSYDGTTPTSRLRLAGPKRPKFLYSHTVSKKSCSTPESADMYALNSGNSELDVQSVPERCAVSFQTSACPKLPVKPATNVMSKGSLCQQHTFAEYPTSSLRGIEGVENQTLNKRPSTNDILLDASAKTSLSHGQFSLSYDQNDQIELSNHISYKDYRFQELVGAAQELAVMDYQILSRSARRRISERRLDTTSSPVPLLNHSRPDISSAACGKTNIECTDHTQQDTYTIKQQNEAQTSQLFLHLNRTKSPSSSQLCYSDAVTKQRKKPFSSSVDYVPTVWPRTISNTAVIVSQVTPLDTNLGAWTRETFDIFGWRPGDAKGV